MDTLQVTGEKFGSAFGKSKTTESEKYNLDHIFDKYQESTDSLIIIKAKDDIVSAKWNRSHVCPLDNSDPIYIHPNQDDIPGGNEKYVRIIHGAKLFISTFLKVHFTAPTDIPWVVETNVDAAEYPHTFNDENSDAI